MADVKGITIPIRGDATELSKALGKIRAEARDVDKELGYINKSLKFNPNNVDLLRQKLAVLNKAAKDNEENINKMRAALEEMQKAGIDQTSAQFRELQREIIKAESKQKAYNKEIKQLKGATSSIGQAAAQMAEFGNKATQAGQALRGVSMAAAGIDAALIALAYKSGQAADDLATLSKVTGISTTELQKYKAAADLVDVSVETIAKSQTRLKKTMFEAKDGTGAAASAFQTLGVSVTGANGELRAQDEVFTEVIAALGSMENETERDALAMQIFGKSASELNPLIEDSGETYARVAKVFADNGLELVDEETLQKANAFNDSLDEIKATWGAAINTIGMQLAGYLAPALEKVAGFIEKVAGWLSQLSPQTLTIIGVIAGIVAGLGPVLIIIGKLAFAISSIMTLVSTAGPIIAAVSGPIGIAVAAIGALIAVGVALYKNWDTIKEYASAVFAKIRDIIANIVEAIKERMAIMLSSFTNAIEFIKSIPDRVRAIVQKIKDFIKLPHFKLTGELSLIPPSVPKISVDWYAKGGIFTKPTIFGGVGVGDVAGGEAVLPLAKLWEEMDKRFAQSGVVVNVYGSDNMSVDELAQKVQEKIITMQNRRRQAWA
jgi:phage-related minor tail protein